MRIDGAEVVPGIEGFGRLLLGSGEWRLSCGGLLAAWLVDDAVWSRG